MRHNRIPLTFIFILISSTSHAFIKQSFRSSETSTYQKPIVTIIKTHPLEKNLFSAPKEPQPSLDFASTVATHGFVGDEYTVTERGDPNVMLGLGYYAQALQDDSLNVMYGANAFYLSPTNVINMPSTKNDGSSSGYQYYVTNIPLNVGTKLMIGSANRYEITFDAGVGSDLVQTSDYIESSPGESIVMNPRYVGGSTISSGATLSAGINLENVSPLISSVKIDYRFFYLGQGDLVTNTPEPIVAEHVGNAYTNALIISASF